MLLHNTIHESHLLVQRVTVAFALILLTSAGLVARLAYLQIAGHAHYSSLSHENRIKVVPIPATRGLILDRHGEVLAENVPIYTLEITPEQVPNLKNTLRELQGLLNLGDDEVARFNALRRHNRPFESTPLRIHLSDDELARFAVRQADFPGVSVQGRLVRRYPFGPLAAHVIGYMGRITEEDLKTLDSTAYRGLISIGKTGLEKTYEDALRGQVSYAEIEANSQGRVIQVVEASRPRAGTTLKLGLDIRLQKIAFDALGEYNGAVVALDVATGQVLAMASKPAFDPNDFVTGIDDADYKALQDDPSRPLYHRALRGQYPPGSTLKPFLALAGLDSGEITPGHSVYCPGFYQLPNVDHHYRDWKKGGHGTVNLASAITESCDVFFYDLAHHLGISRIHDFLARFGFGQVSGIDLGGEARGLLPSPDWKRQARRQSWFPGETLSVGIGQGYFQATPLQLARATAILASRGRMITPRLVEPASGSGAPDLAADVRLDDLHWDVVDSAMQDVVHSPRGTAKGIGRQLEYRIAGKTGTAQVFTLGQNEKYQESAIKEELKDHAWFIAYAPADAPRVAVAVIAEHGGHGGSVAAPIARRVLDHALLGIACTGSTDESGVCAPTPPAEPAQ